MLSALVVHLLCRQICQRRSFYSLKVASFFAANCQVPPNYDSLLGKLIIWADDRDQAIQRMKRALSETVISGVPTTIDYHQLILDTKDFRAGKVDTGKQVNKARLALFT